VDVVRTASVHAAKKKSVSVMTAMIARRMTVLVVKKATVIAMVVKTAKQQSSSLPSYRY